MTAITFPNSPSSGDTHTAGNGIVYTYDGEKWTSIGTNSAGTWTRSGTEVSLTNAGDDLNVDSGTLFVDASTDRVGVGTSSPEQKLDVRGLIQIKNAGTCTLRFNDSTTNYWDLQNDSNFKFSRGGSEYVRIDSSGNVGVGTTSPGSTLELSDGTTTTGPGAELRLSSKDQSIAVADEVIGSITFNNNDASTGMAGVMAKIDAASNRIFDGDNASGMNLRFFAGDKGDGVGTPPERMRITTEGRVGVGTTSPGYPLSIKTTSAGGQSILDLNNEIVSNYGGLRVHLGNTDRECRLEATYGSSFFTFYTAPSVGGSTERVRIDSSGRLLVGTSSFSQNARAVFRGNSGGSIATVYMMRNTTSVSNSQDLGRLHFSDANASIGATIAAAADSTWATNDYPTRLEFSTTADGASSPTERMRISNNGIFSYYTDDSFIIRTASTSSGAGIISLCNGASSVVTGTQVFTVRGDGDVENANNRYGGISDAKLKENIVDAESQWSDLKSLQVRKYNFKQETGYSTHTHIGLVAQEVETVSPGLVSESPDLDEEGNDLGTVTKSVSYSVLYMKAVKALQEAMERIETLEAKVAALEAS